MYYPLPQVCCYIMYNVRTGHKAHTRPPTPLQLNLDSCTSPPLSTLARNSFHNTWSFLRGSLKAPHSAVNSAWEREGCPMAVSPCLKREQLMEPERRGSKSWKCSDTCNGGGGKGRGISCFNLDKPFKCTHTHCISCFNLDYISSPPLLSPSP